MRGQLRVDSDIPSRSPEHSQCSVSVKRLVNYKIWLKQLWLLPVLGLHVARP